jgi:hypothetical protein
MVTKKPIDYLVWHDPSGRSITEKIKMGARHFRKRRGHAPTHCYVNAKTPGLPFIIGSVRVEAGKSILRHDFYFCIDDSKSKRKKRSKYAGCKVVTTPAGNYTGDVVAVLASTLRVSRSAC